MAGPSASYITEAMLAAFAALKQGPMEFTRSGFVASDGRLFGRTSVEGLIARRLATATSAGRNCRRSIVLTNLGRALEPGQQ